MVFAAQRGSAKQQGRKGVQKGREQVTLSWAVAVLSTQPVVFRKRRAATAVAVVVVVAVVTAEADTLRRRRNKRAYIPVLKTCLLYTSPSPRDRG